MTQKKAALKAAQPSAAEPNAERLTPTQPAAASAPQYRSGAVARMLGMPVSTLRIWEQRYQVASPVITPAGHRLYSAADVQRLALIKQLTDHGHAIGAIAALSMAQLQQVASTHVTTAAGARRPNITRAAARPAPWRVMVVGEALAQRLQRAAVQQRLGRPLKVSALFGNLEEALRANRASRSKSSEAPIDLLLWEAPSLHADALAALMAAAAACGARCTAVVYRFAGAAAKQAFAGAEVELFREPQDDKALGAWLAALEAAANAHAESPNSLPFQNDTLWLPAGDAPVRRFDDATLTDFASLSSTVACECPRHVAELLMQLSNFEAYSADCLNRSPADAALHAYLKRVAGASRALFETALERVAIQEGLMLPA